MILSITFLSHGKFNFMEVMGICAICGKPGIMHTCGLCGRNVCSEHFDAAHSICAECRAKINKQKWDIPP